MDIGARLGDDTGDMAGRLPSTYNGLPSEWEEWSWNFKAYISMFETSAIWGVLARVEGGAEPIPDEDLAITLDTDAPEVEASRKAVTFSRKQLLASEPHCRHCETYSETEH